MYIDIFVDIGTHIPMHRRTHTHPYILVYILVEFLSSKKSFLKNISPNTPRIKHLLSLIYLLLLRSQARFRGIYHILLLREFIRAIHLGYRGLNYFSRIDITQVHFKAIKSNQLHIVLQQTVTYENSYKTDNIKFYHGTFL